MQVHTKIHQPIQKLNKKKSNYLLRLKLSCQIAKGELTEKIHTYSDILINLVIRVLQFLKKESVFEIELVS